MDINTLGIGAIMGATVVAGTNLYIFITNRENHYDDLKKHSARIFNSYTVMDVLQYIRQ